MLHSGERQVQENVDGIRYDHKARYDFVCAREKETTILDAACGVGYGAYLLLQNSNEVTAIDQDEETLLYAEKHYPGVRYLKSDLNNPLELPTAEVTVCFETIEHLRTPKNFLANLKSKRLYASVPNQEGFPWNPSYEFHFRHYTKKEFEILLNSCGWVVVEWLAQRTDYSDVEPYVLGRTIIAVCERGEIKNPTVEMVGHVDFEPVPETVTILGLGPSLQQFIDLSKCAGGASALTDEVWGFNALGDVVKCDRLFHMDDVRIQEIRAEAKPDSNIAGMLGWLKDYKGLAYTSRPHKDYPALKALPIEDMLNNLGFDYFNSTAAWAVAYAIHIGVKKIRLFGCDYTYANAHDAEKGRACLEFWLGFAAARGIKISLPKTTSLMDACETRADRLYGYDTVHIGFTFSEGKISLDFSERETLPTAEEIEARYDHSKHPNKLVSK